MTSFSAKNMSCLKLKIVKKKIQIFVMNMPFNLSREARNFLFHS